jgi:hypothetical protein
MIQTHQHSEFGPVPTLLMRPPFPLPPFPMMRLMRLPKGDDRIYQKKQKVKKCLVFIDVGITIFFLDLQQPETAK